jgi:hypothetical protein
VKDGLGRQFRSLLGRASVEREVDDELAFHLEMRTRELIASGSSPSAAGEEARRRFGDLDEVRKECSVLGKAARQRGQACRIRRGGGAGRALRPAPARARAGVHRRGRPDPRPRIGPTTAIFSAVEAVVLRRFDFAHPERTVLVSERWQDQDGGVSAGNYVDWQQRGTGSTRSRPCTGTASPGRGGRAGARPGRARHLELLRGVRRASPPRPHVRRGRGPARASRRGRAGPGAVGAALRIRIPASWAARSA